MSDILRNFTKNVLLEITRYEKETGTKYDILSEIESKITEHPCEYGFTMTDIEKVGVLPLSNRHDTPLGTCFYPLDENHFRKLISNNLPYGTDRKFVGLVKFNFSDKKKWLFLGDDENGNIHKDILRDIKDFALEAIGSVDTVARNNSIDEKIYSVIGTTSIYNSLKYSKNLRKFGIFGVYDKYTGKIDSNEPAQCIALVPNMYTVIKLYDTSELRHPQYENKLTNLENFKLIEKFIMKNIRNRENCKKFESEYFVDRFKKAINYEENERYENFCSRIVDEIVQNENRGCFPMLYDAAIESNSIGALNGLASSINSIPDEYFDDVVKRIITKKDTESFLLGTFLTNVEYVMKHLDLSDVKVETIRNAVNYISGKIKGLSPNSTNLITSIEWRLNSLYKKML